MTLTLPTACVLVGLEPDEIDLADGSETGGLTGSAGGESDEGEGTSNDTDPGDGDAGDGDPGDGDGDPGDGDGDPGTGDGDGDGDPGTGDGDGDGDLPCASAEQVFTGPNPVTVLDGVSQIQGECGGSGPESIYMYTAEADALVQFALTMSDFDGVVYLVDDSCQPIGGLCAIAPNFVESFVGQGQSVFVVVDSNVGGGTGNLEITPAP